MKSQAVSKTFRLLPASIQIVVEFAREQQLSLSDSINRLLKMARGHLNEKQLEKELLELSQDKKWMKENEEWAELDLS